MAPKPRRGRICKLNSETQKIIVEEVEKGVPLKYAAAKAGVKERTVNDWMNWGRNQKERKFVAFFAAVKKAETGFIATHLGYISKDRSWQSRAWLLERMFRETFGTDAKMIREMAKMIKLMTKAK